MASIYSPENAALNDNLPTPPASSATPSHHPSPLPQPRRHPLRPGGPKESELIRYLDHNVNNIQKRVDNRMNNRKERPIGTKDEKGYHAFWEVAKDLDGLADVVWVSGSPNLQIPYLLNLAVLLAEFLPFFSPAPRATFRLLSKLDYAFSALLIGRDPDTNEPLPGFENGRIVSTTDKVRLKGIVDRTRLTVVRVMSQDSVQGEDEDEPEAVDTDGSTDERRGTIKFEGFENNEDEDEDEDEEENWEERQVASVYERTIGELGDVLGGPPIGIITDD